MSFSKAADELNVTPAALSFQIKALEEHLGQPLFNRLNRAVTLTEAGRTLAPGTTTGFEALTTAWRRTRRLGQHQRLTITAGPAFTAKFLAPRMYDFARAHPDVELRFAASLSMADLERDDVDIAIRFAPTPPDGAYSELLYREWMTPMMTPALARDYPRPADLCHAPLLHQDYLTMTHRRTISWTTWFKAAGLPPPPEGGARFTQADHAVDTAIAGGGVVLGRASIAYQALDTGQLVAPFDPAIMTVGSYWAICREADRERPHIAAFFDWIRGEIAQLCVHAENRRFAEPER